MFKLFFHSFFANKPINENSFVFEEFIITTLNTLKLQIFAYSSIGYVYTAHDH